MTAPQRPTSPASGGGVGVRLRLPYLACLDCRTQLVNHLFVLVGTADLLCLFCAVARERRGEGATVAALHAGSEGFAPTAAPTLDQDDAVALLIGKGATIHGPSGAR